MTKIRNIIEKERCVVHPQVEIQFDDGKKIVCDKHISILIEELNGFGFETQYSCQGFSLNERGRREVPYLMLKNPRNLNLKVADVLIRSFWKKYYKIVMYKFGKDSFVWYAYTEKEAKLNENLDKRWEELKL